SAPVAIDAESLFREKNVRNRLQLALLVLGTLAIAAAAAQASAQGWPTRPVTVVVPFAAGSSTDTAARILAVGMSEALGQQLVIENVRGAARMTGTRRGAGGLPVALGTGSHRGVRPGTKKAAALRPLKGLRPGWIGGRAADRPVRRGGPAGKDAGRVRGLCES